MEHNEKNKTAVLAGLAYQQVDGGYPRHKDIHRNVSASKGTVSDWLSKMMDEDLVRKVGKDRYEVSKERLLAYYEDYFQENLRKEPSTGQGPLQERISRRNRIREHVRDDSSILRGDSVWKVVRVSLIGSRGSDRGQTLPEIFFTVDMKLQHIYLTTETSDEDIEELPDLVKLGGCVPELGNTVDILEELSDDSLLEVLSEPRQEGSE